MFEYGVQIGDMHTSRDWGLICTKVEIGSPECKNHFVAVPGRNGSIDLSEVLTGSARYGDREIVMHFARTEKNFDKWHLIYSDILDYCHGQRRRICMDSDRDHYYEGRISVKSSKDFQRIEEFTINVQADPYKYDLLSTTDNWLWGPFNFHTGIIRFYGNISVNGSASIRLVGSQMPTIPIITTTADGMRIRFEGRYYNLKKGKNKITDIYIENRSYDITLTGTGSITIDYRGGRL